MAILDLIDSFDEYKKKRTAIGEVAGPPQPEMITPIPKAEPALEKKEPGFKLPALPKIQIPQFSEEAKAKMKSEVDLWKESIKYMPEQFLNPEQVGRNFSKATDEFFQGTAKSLVGGFFGLGNLFLNAAPDQIKSAGQAEYKRIYSKLQPETPTEQLGAIAESIAEIAVGAGITKVALLKAPSISKFASNYPKVFDALSLGTAGTALGQIRTIPDATFKDRMKKAVIDFPTWSLWGAVGGIAPKAIYKYYPAYFTLGYTSARLEGASNEDAIVSGLVGATVSSLFHLAAKPEKAEALLRKNAEAVLNKYGVTDEASLKQFRTQYHPDVAQRRVGMSPDKAQKVFTQVGQAWDVVSTTPEIRQQTIMQEMSNLWNAVKGKPFASPAPKPAVPPQTSLITGKVAPEAIKPQIPARPNRIDRITEVLNKIPTVEEPAAKELVKAPAAVAEIDKNNADILSTVGGQNVAEQTGRKVETYPSAEEAVTKIEEDGGKSIYKYPFTQADFVMGKIAKGEQLPNDRQLNNIAIDIWKDGGLDLSETGPGTQVDFTGMFFETAETINQSRVYYVKFNENVSPESYEESTGRSILDAVNQDPENLQAGFGVETQLRIGDVVSSREFPTEKTIASGKNKGQKKYEPGYGVIEDIFDNGKALVYSEKGHQVVDFYNLNSVSEASLKNEEIAKIEELKAGQSEKAAAPVKKSYQKIKDVDSTYSPERLKLHKQIIEKLIGDPVVDPDIIKEMIPEYDKDHPELVHDESSHITRKLIVAKIKALKDKPDRKSALNIGPAGAGKTSVLRPNTGPYDLVYEVTGNSIDKLENILRWFKRKGFTVDVNLVGVTLKQSLDSQSYRKQQGLRSIPADIVSDNYPAAFSSFNKLRELADNWRAFDHRVMNKPVLVAKKIGNKLDILDKKGYNDITRGYPVENKIYYEQRTKELGSGEGAGQREYPDGSDRGRDERFGGGDSGRKIQGPGQKSKEIKTEKTIERPPVSGKPIGGFVMDGPEPEHVREGRLSSKKITPKKAYEMAKPEPKPQPKPSFPLKSKPKTSQKKPIAKAKKIGINEAAAVIFDKKSSLPVLAEMKVEDGKLMATDLEVYLTLKSNLPDGMYKPVGKDAMKTKTDPDDFPNFPSSREKFETKFSIRSDELALALKQASLSIPTKGKFPQLEGARIIIEKGEMSVVGTDAFRLFAKNIPVDSSEPAQFTIRKPEKLAKTISLLGEKVTISNGSSGQFDGVFTSIKGPNGELIVINQEGDYPNINAVIPQYKERIRFDRKDFQAAIKESATYAKAYETKQINISFSENVLKVEVSDKSGENSHKVLIDAEISKVNEGMGTLNNGVILMPIVGKGSIEEVETEATTFNIDYIKDALQSLDNDDAYLYRTTEKNTPSFFSNESELRTDTKRVPSGEAAVEGTKIGEYESIGGATGEEMKLYEEVKTLVRRYARTIGEDYLPRSAAGIHYGDTGNIRINGMNQVSVAAHEITHFLDHAYDISKQLMGIRGYASNGNPLYDPDTLKFRKEMTDIYERFYPGAKRTHKLEKRMLEGFATLIEKFAAMPSTMIAEYPNTVREFLATEGRFYKPIIGNIIQDLRDLVGRYQELNALDKIGSRVISGKMNVDKDSFLNFGEKFKTEIADEVFPIEKLAIEAGTHFTKADPSLWVRQYSNSNALILNNIKGDKGYWGWRNGELMKIHDYNWRDLIKEIQNDKKTDEFAYYLVARREHFAYQDLRRLELKVSDAKAAFIDAGELAYDKPEGGISGGKSLADLFKEASEEYKALKEILDKDGFTEEEVSEAYWKNKDRFKTYESKFDTLVREDLEFLHDPYVQLVNDADYGRLAEQEGYASFKRFFYDDIAGEEQTSMARISTGRTKVSSMLRRTGSQKPIVNPLFSSLTNHAEITRKGLKQTVYNRIGGIAQAFPNLFQKLPLSAIPDNQGRILYPQEKDPSIIMARANYKRIPILTDSLIKRTVDEVLNPQNISIFEKLMMAASRFFTKGTTGLFPGFSLTNYTVDQVTASAQTRNNYIPLYDPIGKIFRSLDKDNPEHTYLMEYLILGGERQTFVGWQDMTPGELFEAIGNERKGLLKVADAMNAGMNVLALPAQWSEIMTRATEYIKSRQAGKAQIAALEEAGRVTAPFHHIGRLGGGRFGKTFLKSIPFFNPGIQVLAQAAETVGTKKGRARYGFIALGIIAASIAAMGYLLANGTDEQKDLYADINPDELNKYIWLPDPNGKALIKVRVPDQMEVPATLINMLWSDQELAAQYSAGEYANLATAWLPQQFDVSQPARALMAWIPQVIKPGVLVLAGVKDFPKIMPLESQSQQNKPPGLRFTESTSPVAKELGEKLNLSPIKIDYLLTGYAGRAVGFLTGKPGIYNPFSAMSRQYYFDSGRKLQRYYDLKEENDQDYYAFRHKLKTFTAEERKEKEKMRLYLKGIETLISDYRDIDPDKDPKKAEKYRNEIIKRINSL